MPSNTEINVRQPHIDFAVPRDSSHCMIAEAIKEALPQAVHISIDTQTIRYTLRDKQLRYTHLTPRIAQIALLNFDQEIKPQPFSFRLRGGQITPAGSRKSRADLKAAFEEVMGMPKHTRTKREKQTVNQATMSKARMTNPANHEVPTIIGGNTPPLQMTEQTTTTSERTRRIPFSRRRAFGLRAIKI